MPNKVYFSASIDAIDLKQADEIRNLLLEEFSSFDFNFTYLKCIENLEEK